MQAIVKNFRGINSAQISISPIALLCGLNGAGKTSMARGIGAAATGKPIPYTKVTKKDCKILLRQGTKAGMAGIGNENGSTQIEWPKAEVISTGTPPVASDIAVGITDLFSMKEADALAYMISLLKAEPTQEDLLKEFIGTERNPAEVEKWKKTAEAVWEVIKAQGWPAAHKQASEKGSMLKGAWQKVAGTNYGSKKADEWFPEGWDDILLQHTPETLQAAIDDAQKKLEDAIGKSAVSQAEQQNLQNQADELPELEKDLSEKKAAHAAAVEALGKVEEKLRATPNPSSKKEYDCPHCAGKVNITAVSGTDYLLSKAEKASEEADKKARNVHAGLCGEQQRLKGDAYNAQQAFNAVEFKRDAALKAQEKLKGLGDASVMAGEDVVTAARANLDSKRNIVVMVEKYHEARRISGLIALNQLVIDALDETGIRKKKLGGCLDAFAASYIAPICDDFGILPILIDPDLSVSMGDTTYPMLSASEQFRVRSVLQMAIAKLEGSALLIIDGADILDKTGRMRLLNAVMRTQIRTIICMTLNKPEMAPNLAEAGVGITYWVENGTCRTLTGGAEPNKQAA
jgi:hypothetical protein